MMTLLTPFENVLDEMWNDMDMTSRFTEVPTNVKEDSDGYTIEMAVPGLERKNFHMKVRNGDLCLKIRKGHRFSWPWQKNHVFIRSERHLHVPADIDAKKITAKVDNGIMYIRLPKKDNYIDVQNRQSKSNVMREIHVA